jgi:tRNA(Ile)-lysidine synthase
MESIEANILETLRTYIETRIPESDLYIVAVSGGPDSVALLLGLAAIQRQLAIKLHVAHYNHNLRADSTDDAEFVADLAESIGVPFAIGTATEEEYKQVKHLSPEAAARELRYRFLGDTAQQFCSTSIVVGHTADDQTETILLHVVRGAGLTGITGMQSTRNLVHDGKPLTLVRPFLNITHTETMAFCEKHNIKPIMDPTNADTTIPRNHLRIEILPRLATLNPKITPALHRLAHAVTIDMDYIATQTDSIWQAVVQTTPDGVFIDTTALNSAHPALIRHLLRRAYVYIQGDETGLEQVHIEEMAKKARGQAGTRLSLPNKITIEFQHHTAWLSRGIPFPCPLPALRKKHDLIVPGRTDLDGWIVNTRLVSTDQISSEKRLVAYFDQELVGAQISVRTRNAGDRFSNSRSRGNLYPDQKRSVPFGKKIQDLLVNYHIPSGWRDRVPLVVSGDDILWIVGWQVARWAQAHSLTKRILEVGFWQAQNKDQIQQWTGKVES